MSNQVLQSYLNSEYFKKDYLKYLREAKLAGEFAIGLNGKNTVSENNQKHVDAIDAEINRVDKLEMT